MTLCINHLYFFHSSIVSQMNHLQALVDAVSASPACAISLVNFWMRDVRGMSPQDFVKHILTEPVCIRLCAHRIGVVTTRKYPIFGVSLYLTDSFRVTDGFLTSTKNVEALSALSSLGDDTSTSFLCSWGNPVTASFRCEVPSPSMTTVLPREKLALAALKCQMDYIRATVRSPALVLSAWAESIITHLSGIKSEDVDSVRKCLKCIIDASRESDS
jgi:hypothetical protein